ncbi:hypothetical protein [Ferrimonas sp. SCSIO 43195]|uniref:hypothetical protein n=1 Tax=Ferrimonas sp. SCSIO 43195 TaxID=2822844 RepID=UPI002075E49D|nr:hypothetical protein [Ferrimonas sp. SCSIO 43195]USD37716.1 hypothetical protein J8Z22_00565 [Ferrimonas sp. SCSIO 43195]
MTFLQRQHRIAQLSLRIDALLNRHPCSARQFRYLSRSSVCNRIAFKGIELCQSDIDDTDALASIASYLHQLEGDRDLIDDLALQLIRPLGLDFPPLQKLIDAVPAHHYRRSMLMSHHSEVPLS